MELVLALLVGTLLVHFVLTHFERKDMLDRLMAKNLPEYKDNIKPEENQLEEEDPDETVAIEEAESDLLEEDDGKKE